MKSLLSALPIAFILSGFASAEETLDETVVIDFDARRQSVVTMREHIKMREKTLDELAEEIRERGQSIDRRIGKIVTTLANMKDSQSSKTRISMLKSEAAQGLVNMIETYQVERRKIIERAKTDASAPTDALSKDIEQIDKQVNIRAEQIVKLVKSIPGQSDVKKYVNDGGAYGGSRWGYSTSRVSETWKQNRRDKVQSTKMRREAQKALAQAVENLERRQDQIRAFLDQRQMTAPEREIQQQELAYVGRTLDARRKQLAEVTLPASSGNKNASKNEADDMKHLFEDASNDLSRDFWRTIQLYHQASDKRDSIHSLKLNLEAREKWLKENDPDWKG